MMNQRSTALRRMGKLRLVLILTSSYFVVQILGGLLTGSLALIADAGHMLTDIAGLTLSLLAVSFTRKPATPLKTYGFYRMEILATLANSVVLISISVYIIFEAYQRILVPAEINAFPMIFIASMGLVVNLISLKLLSHSHGGLDSKDENLNIRSASLEVLSDALGSIGVIVAGIIIVFSGLNLADPIASIAIAIFILPRTWSLMKKSIHILMEGVPVNISHDEVKKAIMGVKGVTGIFELHIWSITSGLDALSAHVVIIDPGKSISILKEINSIIENKFGIHHSTIQIETYHSDSDSV